MTTWRAAVRQATHILHLLTYSESRPKVHFCMASVLKVRGSVVRVLDSWSKYREFDSRPDRQLHVSNRGDYGRWKFQFYQMGDFQPQIFYFWKTIFGQEEHFSTGWKLWGGNGFPLRWRHVLESPLGWKLGVRLLCCDSWMHYDVHASVEH